MTSVHDKYVYYCAEYTNLSNTFLFAPGNFSTTIIHSQVNGSSSVVLPSMLVANMTYHQIPEPLLDSNGNMLHLLPGTHLRS